MIATFQLSSAASLNLGRSQSVREWVNPLPEDKILALSKMKAFEDNNISVIQMTKIFFDGVENMVVKGENVDDQQFLLFPQCFQKASFPGASKVDIAW